MQLDINEAPIGFYASLKSEAPREVGNICNVCDWRTECQKNSTDFTLNSHRCMSSTVVTNDGLEIKRNDGCSVVFKKNQQSDIFET